MNTLLILAETVTAAPLMSVLIWLLIFAVVIWLVYFILSHTPIPEPVRTVVLVIVGIILLLVLFNRLGFL